MQKRRPTRMATQSENIIVDPSVAIKKLTALLDKIPWLKSQSAESPEFKAWESDAKIAMRNLYGEHSEEWLRFNSIWFTPRRYYHGQPNREFVEALNQGLEEARLFLISRLEDWNNSPPLSPDQTASPAKSSKHVFVVHGHDEGVQQSVARFLEKLGLTPVILHERPNQGRTVIEKFEAYSNVGF